jgi:mono/diheme cytochrome c family protein
MAEPSFHGDKSVKKALKVLGGVLLFVLVVAAAGLTWLAVRRPAQRPATSEKFEATPARLGRGQYLVEHVTACLGCHSDHFLRFGFPIKPGSEGEGGFPFGKEFGVPGRVTAQNITPDRDTGLGLWSDDEIARAIREGVNREGEALFPMMPYSHYRELSDEDVKSIVVHLRTLEPIRNETPERTIDFPVNLLIKFAPKPIESPVQALDPSNTVAYGRYLSRISGCYECHTPHDDKGRLIAEKAFAGGWEMRGPWGRNFTSNLTPHSSTFVGQASREEFISRFQSFAGMNATNAPIPPPGRNTIMPWLAFSLMNDRDLGAIYDYLKTVPAIDNPVNAFPDAK